MPRTGTINGIPYWRLSGFYFFTFALLGTLMPYWNLYLKSLGFDVREIAALIAIMTSTKIIAPNVWGWLADHTGQRMRLIRLGALTATILFTSVFFTVEFWPLAAIFLAFSFFWNAILAQYEVVTLGYLTEKPSLYGQIRLWGSVGFIASVTLVGKTLDVFDMSLLPAIVLGLLGMLWLCSLMVQERSIERHTHQSQPFFKLLKKPSIIAFFSCCFLIQLSHGPYYALYSVFLEDLGYSRTVIGSLWALGVIAEITIFLCMHRLMYRFGARKLIIFSLASGVLRWILIGAFPENFTILLCAQALHAFTFGTFHATAIYFVDTFFKGTIAGKGQALYSSISFGGGIAIGSFIAGQLWLPLGSLYVYLLASATCMAAMLIAIIWLRPAMEQPLQPA